MIMIAETCVSNATTTYLCLPVAVMSLAMAVTGGKYRCLNVEVSAF
jgi:hypothetical protein